MVLEGAYVVLHKHLLASLRAELHRQGIANCQKALSAKDEKRVVEAGLVLVQRRPGSAESVVFMTLKEKFVSINTIIWPNISEAYRQIVLVGNAS